jgi:6-phosphogluconolactonase (cycloisomerase 2 family)
MLWPSGSCKTAHDPRRFIGIQVTPDGKFVVVALPVKASLEVYAIAANGALAEIHGSPFGAAGFPTGLDINCGGRFLFVGDGGDTTQVEVYAIGPQGRLAASPARPLWGARASIPTSRY